MKASLTSMNCVNERLRHCYRSNVRTVLTGRYCSHLNPKFRACFSILCRYLLDGPEEQTEKDYETTIKCKIKIPTKSIKFFISIDLTVN